ncbi:hypothetical protein MRX96_056188 [Rhipicephalus microplus]|uniref:TNF receptor-associated factor 6 n=1 Tax=Rhipicephalus microplus TaxID=6941 RepID=UPI003F6D6B41
MADLSRVYRFRDIPIKGVNWRPTRFVDEVPDFCLCGLCLMIPKRTVWMPCGHRLCNWCHAFKSAGRGRVRCPLDEEEFEVGQCRSDDLPFRTAKAFQVYCWNEVQGCEFKGALKDMLLHYENGCTFSSVKDLQCGDAVLNKDVEPQQVAGCSKSVSPACTESTVSKFEALTLEDVESVEGKTPLSDSNHDKVIPACPSCENGLTKVCNKESRVTVVTGEVGPSVLLDTVQHSGTAYTTASQEPASRQNPAKEASM